MVKDLEDNHGLQTTNFKNLGKTFQDLRFVRSYRFFKLNCIAPFHSWDETLSV